MNKPKLFVAEKPQQAEIITQLMEKNDVVILAQSIAAYQFDYQEINFKNAPYTREKPKYKKSNNHSGYKDNIFNIGKWDYKYNYSGCSTLKEIEELDEFSELIKEYFNQFSEVICSCDYDLTGYRGFSLRMSYFFKLGSNWIDFFQENNIKLTVIKIKSYSNEILINSYQKRLPIKDNKNIELLKNSYMKKDYFEYNYNLNSILFFEQALKDVGYIKDSNYHILTKNYIWVLFELNKNKLPFFDLVDKMKNYYIANSASYWQLLKNLKLMKLINYEDSDKKMITEISDIGVKFINRLHKKANDPFIGIRLLQNNYVEISQIDSIHREKANNLSYSDFKFKYEKYLYNTFSKQKRFLRKKL